ncbi:MAG: hypothetical protein JSW55_10285 [Chloroflexota bacterium]|nr:MAG: hypothetical protein JSW55_10285 [Chloroflexota bacterium]
MRTIQSLQSTRGHGASGFGLSAIRVPRHFVLGLLLIFALLAFEAFNFDTTRFALNSLLGDVRFAGIAWATILAIAFCAIDFAGLGRLLTPERGVDEPKEIWYLTGAWLLGATMNAVMTWWAVSTVLLSHDLGNEVLSREQLLHIVPVFVAVLVWLTRILFIGAVSIAGERLLHGVNGAEGRVRETSRQGKRRFANRRPAVAANPAVEPAMQASSVKPGAGGASTPKRDASGPSRITRRPPRPQVTGGAKQVSGGLRAAGLPKRL